MKLCKRIVVLFIACVMLWGACLGVCADTESPNTGFYGYEGMSLKYPVTSRFMNTFDEDNRFGTWYKLSYSNYKETFGELEYMSRLWYDTYRFGDPEMWHEAYIERFEPMLPSAGEQGDSSIVCEIEAVYLKDNKLTVKCGTEFYMVYSYYKNTMGEGVYYVSVLNYDINSVLVVRDKTDGSLICLGRVIGGAIVPEYRYGHYSEKIYASYGEDYYVPYTSRVEKTFEVTLPDFVDPEKHTLELYFSRDVEMMAVDDPTFTYGCEISLDEISEPEPPVTTTVTEKPEPEPDPEPEPVRGDANGDGAITLADVSLALKYISEWDVIPDVKLADANGNGRVGLEDVSMILKLIAGWGID